jgi:hypothetical protein
MVRLSWQDQSSGGGHPAVAEGAGEPVRHTRKAEASQRLLASDGAASGTTAAFFFRPEGVSGEETQHLLPAHILQERTEARTP